MFQTLSKKFVLTLAAVLVFTASVAQAANVEGKITAINASQKTVTIQPKVGAAVTVKIVPSTPIEVNGNETTFSALKVGWYGDCDYVASSKVATGLDAFHR
jgi:ABC-type Fe3+-hydroxamate transport system substrate-binding protein